MTLFYFLVALLLIVVIRAWTLHISSGWFIQGFTGDSSVHLKIVQSCREGVKNINNYVIPNRMSYPVLFHQFCALFPKEFLTRKSYIPNFILYVLFAVFLFLYTTYIGNSYILDFPQWGGFAVVLFFVISVQNLISIGPSIAYLKLSSRFMGKIGASIFMVGLAAYMAFNDVLSLFLATLGASIGFLASTFAAQVLIFSALILSIILLSISPILIVGLGLLAAIFLSRGYAWISVISMVRYWAIYKKYVAQSRYQKPSLSHYIDFCELLNHIKNFDYKKVIGSLLQSEPSRTFLFYPELIIVGIWLIIHEFSSPFVEISKYIMLSIFALYLITSTKRFNFLGEAYRYFEYSLAAIIPFLFLLLIIENEFGVVTLFLLGFYGLSVFFWSMVLQLKLGHKPAENGDVLNEFLNKLKITEMDVIFPVSMRLGADIVARTNCKSFWWQPGGITEPEMFEKYIDEYPYLSTNWKVLAEKHNVNIVVADKTALALYEGDYDFNNLKIILSSDNFIAYEYKSGHE